MSRRPGTVVRAAPSERHAARAPTSTKTTTTNTYNVMTSLTTTPPPSRQPAVRWRPSTARRRRRPRHPDQGHDHALRALFAEVERDLISERTREGLAKARASGRKLGRPKGSLGVSRLDGKEDEIRHFLELGVSKTAIAKIVKDSLPRLTPRSARRPRLRAGW